MTLIYGHRGARGEAPENTLAGFELCLELGVTRCELDLHLSRDGELVVIHDPTLKRTTGRGGKVSEKAVADLIALDARQGGPVWPLPCPIPTLRELFEKCSFEHWQLEVKSASRVRAAQTVRAIAQLVDEFGLQDKVTVTSSSREVLRALNRSGRPRGAAELVADCLPATSVTLLNYHAAVLERCDLVRVIENDVAGEGFSRRYASNVTEDVQIIAILSAIEAPDRLAG